MPQSPAPKAGIAIKNNFGVATAIIIKTRPTNTNDVDIANIIGFVISITYSVIGNTPI